MYLAACQLDIYLCINNEADLYVDHQPALQAFPWGWGAKKDRGTGFSMFFPHEKWARAKTLKILFLGLYLLFNPSETLATQTSRSRIISSVQWTVFLVCLGRNFLSKPLTHLCFSLPIQGPLVISWFALWCIRTKECRQP